MGINKVVINKPTGEEILIDLTMDSVIPEKLHKGFTAHNSKGEPIIGTYEVGNGEAEFTVWEKRTIGRHVDYYSMEFGESDTTSATVSSFNDQHKRILYADYSFDEVTGVITLSNPLSTTQTSSADQVTNYEQYPYYYGDRSQGNTDNTVYKLTSVTSSGTSSYNKTYTWKFDKAIVSENGAYDIAGELIETIADTNSTAYPDNGVQDGYWYIKAGSGEGGTTEVKLQSKSATPSETEQTIQPDSGYDGLSQVVIEAIPSDFVGSSVTKLGEKTYTPSDSQQTIEAGQYLDGEQTILPVPTETKTITENGTYTPDVGKFFSSITVEVPTGGESGGIADISTKEVTPNSNALSIEFTGLTGEPSAFAIQPVEDITLSSTRSVVSVTYDGTKTEGVCGYSSGSFMSSSAKNAYFASDFTWKYENGTLTVTSNSASTSGYFKSGTTYKLFYVTGGASGGGSATEPNLQSKSVTPSETAQTITPDNGYDGLSQVSVGAISNTYIGSGVTKLAAKTYTPSTSQQTIASGQYLDGAQTISAVPTETKTITENGTHKPSTGKFFSQVTVNVPTGGGDGLPDVIVAGDTPILADWEGVQSNSLTPTSLGLSLTIPKNGTYRFYVPTSGGSVLASTQPTLEIYKNGVPSGVTASLPNMVQPYPRRFDVECAEGDVVEVYGTSVKSNSSNVTITALALIACIDK